MGLYDRYVVPRLVTCACGTKPVIKQRQKVVPKAMGTVLEFGIGAGHNLPHYDSSRIDRVIGVDPCATSWELASERAANLDFDVEFIQGSALDVPIEDASVDSVLITFTLCTVPDPMAALREAKRTLKPGGKVYFCEHGLAPDERVAKWQNRVNPIWKKVFGGCHINRDTAGLLTEAGFKLDELEQMYLPGTPTIAGFNTWGEASFG
jgi:ubiquinone/menaquinone biosynthesis C-methylase UbiE